MSLEPEEEDLEEAVPAKKAAPKKRARRKIADTIPEETSEVPTPEKPLYPKVDEADFDSIKVPELVKSLHENDFPRFKELYGLHPKEEKKPINTIVLTEKEDTRYPARKQTCLTVKAFR